MKTVYFYKTNYKTSRNNNTLHIETEGCIINVRINLNNVDGKKVTSVEILPDEGWELEGNTNNRIIKNS